MYFKALDPGAEIQQRKRVFVVIIPNANKDRSCQMNQPQFLTEEESLNVDAALLTSPEKFLARLTISSHRLLAIIAKDCDCAIADLEYQQIIEWFEKDSKTRMEQGIDAAVLKW